MAWDAWRRHVSPTTWAAVVDAYHELHRAIDYDIDLHAALGAISGPEPKLERRASSVSLAAGVNRG